MTTRSVHVYVTRVIRPVVRIVSRRRPHRHPVEMHVHHSVVVHIVHVRAVNTVRPVHMVVWLNHPVVVLMVITIQSAVVAVLEPDWPEPCEHGLIMLGQT